jgi:hypothetical protein
MDTVTRNAREPQDRAGKRQRLRWWLIGGLLWLLAIVMTLASAVYQRMTGPTHPLDSRYSLAGQEFSYSLTRSGTTGVNEPVTIPAPEGAHGILSYKRYKTDDEYTSVTMEYRDGALAAELPEQPPAGKLEYFVMVGLEDDIVQLPEHETTVIRFKGAVPAGALVPHIFAMFFALLWGMRALLAVLTGRGGIGHLSWTTFILLTIGGMILGPVVQYHAFGEAWTGVPFGWDLTDNKTLLSWLAWLVAVIFLALRSRVSSRVKRWAVLAAAVVMIGIYLIPHSMYGSELDYEKLEQGAELTDAIRQG